MRIAVERNPTALDRYVCKFIHIIKKYTDYVIVSGYIAILLGMERTTFDVDVLAGNMEKKRFVRMIEDLKRNDFLIIENPDVAYIHYTNGHTLSIHTQDVWYFDFKMPKDKWGFISLKYPLTVRTDLCELRIAPPEIQIPYKLKLGSDKDIKDAVFIYEKLRSIIDERRLKEYADAMGVDIEVIL